MSIFLGFLLSVTAIFLIMLVLVQRGRGGGLAGALGGMGGSSAFGAKAGDVFTRITVITASIWILLCVASVKLLSEPDPTDLTTDTAAPALPSGTLTAPEGEGQEAAIPDGTPAEPSPPDQSGDPPPESGE